MDGFVRISKYAGMREDLVQAGGGNSAFKISPEKMFIKASGFQLAEVTEIDGYATVNPCVIRDAFLSADCMDEISETMGKRILEEAYMAGRQPSIETFLHAMSGKYSLHTHPIVVNALACRKDGMEVLKKLFPDALFVPYATPGIELAKAYFKAYRNGSRDTGKEYDVVFLQNHGMLISSDTADGILERTEAILYKIEEFLGINMASYHTLTNLWELFEKKILWRVTDENVLNVYSNKKGMWDHAFCPDCVVFLGKKPLVLHSDFLEEKHVFESVYGEPVMVVHKDNLYIVADSVKKALEIQSVMSFSAQVMELNDEVECNLLSDQEQNYLLNWDAEKYRKELK